MLGVALPGPVVLALEVAGGMLAGATFGRSWPRLLLSGAIVALVLALPFLASPDDHVARTLAGLGGMLGVMRFIEARRTRAEPVVPRAFIFVLPIDMAQARRAPPRLALDVLARTAVYVTVAGVGIGIVSVRALAGAWAPVVAWLGGVVAVYGGLDAAASSLRFALAAVGVESASMQRDPILSTSVAEFWGERWNRAVGAWLRRHCFVPAMRRWGAVAGITAAFAWSTLVHFWMTFTGLGLEPALRMGAFFVVQGLLLLVERRLPVGTWPRPLARAWTFAMLLGPSPLFIGPALQMFGVR